MPQELPTRSLLSRRSVLASGAAAGGLLLAGCSASAGTPPDPDLTPAQPLPEPSEEGTRDWIIRDKDRAPAGLIEGYAGQSSVSPGDPVTLHVGTSADQWTALAYRIGDYDGKGAVLVGAFGPFRGKTASGPSEDSQSRATSAGWAMSAELDTSDWAPGFYMIHIVAEKKRTDIPLVVRSDAGQAADSVAIIHSATTWQAYNGWGGRSLYRSTGGSFGERSYEVRGDRPYDSTGRGLLYAFEIPVVRQAEAAGVPVSYLTNIDLGRDAGLIADARGAISTGHDEYWSVEYRDALEQARGRGTNLLFAGANVGYWRVRLKEGDTAGCDRVVCYKSAELDPETGPAVTARWRDAPDPRPENQITGQLYDAYPVTGAFKVRDPDFFLFKGTAVDENSSFAGLIGPESDRLYPGEDTPKPIEVPALSEVVSHGKKTWSTMTYYTAESGAGVIATGTMSWTRSLPREKRISGIPQRTSDFTTQVTRNMIVEMQAGPMGLTHPATDHSDEVTLPSYNTNGSA